MFRKIDAIARDVPDSECTGYPDTGYPALSVTGYRISGTCYPAG